MNNNIPDFVYQQAYLDQIYERVNLHFEVDWSTGEHLMTTNFPVMPLQTGTHELKLTFQGKFVQAEIHYQTDTTKHANKRSYISDFSAQSRKRLLDLFHRLDIRVKPIFLTLTYGDDFPEASEAKKDFRAFLEWLRRKTKARNTSGIWRMEFQERGAPHFHIMLFDCPFIKKEVIQERWGQIIGVDKPFTRIEQIRSFKGVMAYVSKYIAKVDPGKEASGFNSPTYLHAYVAKYGNHTGRFWGYFEKSKLPFAEKIELSLPFDRFRFECFKRCAEKKYAPIADYESDGFSLYVSSAERWLELFHTIYDKPF